MVEVRSDVFTSDDRACVPTTKAHYRTQHSTCSKSVASLSILRSHAVQLSPLRLMSFSCLSSSSLLPVFFQSSSLVLTETKGCLGWSDGVLHAPRRHRRASADLYASMEDFGM